MLGLGYQYSNQDTVPKGVMLENWTLGGMKIQDALQQLEGRINILEERKVKFISEQPEQFSFTYSLKEIGVSYSADELQTALKQLTAGNMIDRIKARYSFHEQWNLHTKWDDTRLKNKLNGQWEKETFGVPVNAVRNITKSDTIEYIPEKNVYRIDWTLLSQQIEAMLPSDFTANKEEQSLQITLPLIIKRPAITVNSLKAEGIERKMIQFTTDLYTSGEGRVYNVSSAAKIVDGMILKPGEIFNYAEVIAAADKKYGFREAPVILNGKLVPGIGGGICQVSSTLYNAAIRTGLEIVERRNHSLPVSYLPKGQDATFAEGVINFRFKNNTGKSLLIQSAVNNRKLTVKLFGTLPRNVTYTIESHVVEILTAPDKYVQNPSLAAGTRQVLQGGKPGYVVDTYQIKRVDGKVTEKKRISHDTYRAQPSLIAVGVTDSEKSSPAPSKSDQKSILEDGIEGPVF
nr:VanW family protein [Paenibacillus sediminis]